MYTLSIAKAILVGLLASAPLATAYGVGDVVSFEKRHVGSLASYASKVVRAAVPDVMVEKRQAPDEFGPWDSTEDEFGSWVDKREPHHTEAQIAEKQQAAAAAAAAAAPAASSGSSGTCNNNKKRHHTEAQIAAKQAAAIASAGSTGSAGDNCGN